jgi:hypothetical protein
MLHSHDHAVRLMERSLQHLTRLLQLLTLRSPGLRNISELRSAFLCRLQLPLKLATLLRMSHSIRLPLLFRTAEPRFQLCDLLRNPLRIILLRTRTLGLPQPMRTHPAAHPAELAVRSRATLQRSITQHTLSNPHPLAPQ